ncbi:39S ribosomal protein L45, mitochondrial [Ornithorhynchus anatinus]|uniref:Large ribosomal subunit protein mL45 n=1 Tax=Ornithorhynchus anatinus TaxID=9258 RepID=A0A6I8NYB0_ORNAN|nr:39S ribosomal protein L45, mitochondrial [Ornithorhynchus anatinus]
MAAPTRTGAAAWSRLRFLGRWSPQCPDVRPGPAAVVIPVRTKRRFTPPQKKAKFWTEEENRARARAAGIVIPNERPERPIVLNCTAGVFDPYIPPEGDARLTPLLKAGLKQRVEQLKQRVASQLAIRKVKEHDTTFSVKTFATKAQEIFTEAHDCLNTANHDKLHELVTEYCFPKMAEETKLKTVRWRFVESLEPPRVVQVRCTDMVSPGNVYGQVTVRMHTRQALAIYDRFGRLMYGREDLPRDVLEYVVLEKQLRNPYGAWRLHDKIVPPWAPAPDAPLKTVLIPGPGLLPGEELRDPDVATPPSPPTAETPGLPSPRARAAPPGPGV